METNQTKITFSPLAALLLAVGLVIGAYLIGSSIRYLRNFERAVEVKGLAEQTVKADLATWTLNYSVSGANLSELYEEMNKQQRLLANFMREHGLAEATTQLGSLSVTDNWAAQYGSSNPKVPHYQISNSFTVTSKQVDAVESASQAIAVLVQQGIILNSNNLNYFYTGLNSIKSSMLAAAIDNAHQAAEAFAKTSHSHVGAIKAATQGVFSIMSPDGLISNDTTNLYKKVRVVSSIQFFLN